MKFYYNLNLHRLNYVIKLFQMVSWILKKKKDHERNILSITDICQTVNAMVVCWTDQTINLKKKNIFESDVILFEP